MLAGDSLTDPATLGLDAAFPALFLALMAPLVWPRDRAPATSARRGRDRTPLVAALLGAAIALAATPFTPAGLPVIAATAACLVGFTVPRDPSRSPPARVLRTRSRPQETSS